MEVVRAHLGPSLQERGGQDPRTPHRIATTGPNPISPRQLGYLAKKKSMVHAQGTANAMRTRSGLSRPITRIGIHSSSSTQDMLNMTLAGALVYTRTITITIITAMLQKRQTPARRRHENVFNYNTISQ